MTAVDLQQIIADKLRFHIEVDLRLGGNSGTHTIAHVVMKDLTKQESEMVISRLIQELQDIEEDLEPDDTD